MEVEKKKLNPSRNAFSKEGNKVRIETPKDLLLETEIELELSKKHKGAVAGKLHNLNQVPYNLITTSP